MDKIEELLTSLKGEDDLGVIIRSHIIIEKYLNALIDGLVKSPSHVKKMKLDYSSTVKLAVSLGLNPRFESSLNTIGTIRNDFAHNLRSCITNQDSNNLYKSLDEKSKEVLHETFNSFNSKSSGKLICYNNSNPKDRTISIIMVICGNLHTALQLLLDSKKLGTLPSF